MKKVHLFLGESIRGKPRNCSDCGKRSILTCVKCCKCYSCHTIVGRPAKQMILSIGY